MQKKKENIFFFSDRYFPVLLLYGHVCSDTLNTIGNEVNQFTRPTKA